MRFVRDMRNIGPESARWLADVDIVHAEDLEKLGPVEAYKKVKAKYPENVSLNMLWGLYGAVHDVAWNEIDEKTKNSLREQL